MSELGQPYDWEQEETFQRPYNPAQDELLQEITADHEEHAATAASSERNIMFRPRRVAALALAWGTFFAVTDIPFDNTDYKAITVTADQMCGTPSPHDMHAVQELFNRNQNVPAYNRYAHQYNHNLKLVDQLDALPYGTPASTEKFIVSANQILQTYGVRIDTNNDSNLDKGWHSPTKQQLLSRIAKRHIEYIVEGTLALPRSYVKYSGLKRIVLLANESTDSDQAYVESGPDRTKDAVYYNIALKDKHMYDRDYDGYFMDTIPHETYHLVDHLECGDTGMYNDPTYTTINKTNVYHQSGDESILIMGDKLLNQYSKLTKEKIGAYYDGDRRTYCDVSKKQKSIAAKVKVASRYSLTNVVEDKAEMGAEIGFPDEFERYLNPDFPVIKLKFETLLARLYAKRPEIVKHLAAISTRPEKTLGPVPSSDPVQCN